MPVNHIEVDEVGKDQAIAGFFHVGLDRLLRVPVVSGVVRFRYAAMGHDVLDFTHRIYRNASLGQFFEHGGFGRFKRIVAAVFRPGKRTRFPDKRAGDDASYAVIIAQFPTDLTGPVQFGEGNDFFVCRNLKNAVGAGVHDPFVFLHLALAVFVNDAGAARRLVPKYGAAGAVFELLDEFVGERRGAGRK